MGFKSGQTSLKYDDYTFKECKYKTVFSINLNRGNYKEKTFSEVLFT